MEVLEDTLPIDLDAFLERPLFCFLATSSEDGAPRVTPLWYLWEDRSLWIIANYGEKTYPHRVEREARVDVAIVEFDPTSGRVWHVGMRGRATVEPFDEDLAVRLLSRYLGPDQAAWDGRFRGPWDDRWRLLQVEPTTVLARDQSYEVSPP